MYSNGNWTKWSAIQFEIKQVISKSTSMSHLFDLKSQVRFQTKIAWNEVQLPFYYIHFYMKTIILLAYSICWFVQIFY